METQILKSACPFEQTEEGRKVVDVILNKIREAVGKSLGSPEFDEVGFTASAEVVYDYRFEIGGGSARLSPNMIHRVRLTVVMDYRDLNDEAQTFTGVETFTADGSCQTTKTALKTSLAWGPRDGSASDGRFLSYSAWDCFELRPRGLAFERNPQNNEFTAIVEF
jgi:hypothetical protein